MPNILSVKNLSYYYQDGDTRRFILRDASFDFERGKFYTILGESGSGKTTVLMAIPGLLPQGTALSGRIILEGKDLLSMTEEELNRIRWRRIALVPQGAMNSFTPVITVGRHVEEVLSVHLGLSRRESEERIPSLFALAGLDGELARRYPHELW